MSQINSISAGFESNISRHKHISVCTINTNVVQLKCVYSKIQSILFTCSMIKCRRFQTLQLEIEIQSFIPNAPPVSRIRRADIWQKWCWTESEGFWGVRISDANSYALCTIVRCSLDKNKQLELVETHDVLERKAWWDQNGSICRRRSIKIFRYPQCKDATRTN